MKRIALAIALLVAAATAALAQNVTVIGPITPGHCPQFSSTTVIKDGGFNCSGAPGNAITAVTGDGTATGPGSVPFTLTTVNPNVGSFGSATQCVAITTNGKGLITAAAAVTCTPAIASITGLGTGVAAALANALNGAGGLVGFTNAFSNIAPIPTRAGDIIYWGGSAWTALPGNNSGTLILSENASGVPSWSAAGAGSVNTAGTGITLTSAGSTVNLALTNATLNATPANPTGMTGTSTLMMGLGSTCKITPVYSGRLHVTFSGGFLQTAGGATTFNIRFGTGTAPTNGAAAAGTISAANLSIGGTAVTLPYSQTSIITGLTVGTQVWLDLSMATTASGTATIANVTCAADEF